MTLPAFDLDGINRVLCVVAHPDDMEYGSSAAVAHMTDNGIQVAYLLLTSGEAGMQTAPEEVGPLRAKEQQEACSIVGVSELTILNHPDGMLVYSLDLRRDVARVIRTFKPDAIITSNFEVEAYGTFNQADHRVAGLVTVDAIRDADNNWVFRELMTNEDLAKWSTKWLLIGGHPDVTHGIELTQSDVDRGVQSLAAHKAYLGDLPNHPKPEEFIPEILREGGKAMGVEYAETYKVLQMGGIGGE